GARAHAARAAGLRRAVPPGRGAGPGDTGLPPRRRARGARGHVRARSDRVHAAAARVLRRDPHRRARPAGTPARSRPGRARTGRGRVGTHVARDRAALARAPAAARDPGPREAGAMSDLVTVDHWVRRAGPPPVV